MKCTWPTRAPTQGTQFDLYFICSGWASVGSIAARIGSVGFCVGSVGICGGSGRQFILVAAKRKARVGVITQQEDPTQRGLCCSGSRNIGLNINALKSFSGCTMSFKMVFCILKSHIIVVEIIRFS